MILAILTVWCLLVTTSVGAGTVVESMDLTTMSDEELEDICAERGFELIKDELDEETGELIVFTRDDYIDAARQCLLIEQQLYVS